jgi:hypothetical protein
MFLKDYCLEDITGLKFVYVSSKRIKLEEADLAGGHASAITMPNTGQRISRFEMNAMKSESNEYHLA